MTVSGDFVPMYHHAKFDGDWTTTTGDTMCLPAIYSPAWKRFKFIKAEAITWLPLKELSTVCFNGLLFVILGFERNILDVVNLK